MIAIICLDQNNGMFFNDRRQSKDRTVRKDILSITAKKRLFMTEYSYAQFKEDDGCDIQHINICTDFFEQEKDDYCLIENCYFDDRKAERLIVYRWDKVYPADHRYNLNGWNLKNTMEFQGYSHDKITREIYEKD